MTAAFDCLLRAAFRLVSAAVSRSARGGWLPGLLLTAVFGLAACETSAAEPDSRLAEQELVQIEATVGQYVREQRSSFALAVLVEHGVVRLARSYGVENPESQEAIAIDDSLIDLASIRKLFIAVAIAKLIDQKRIASIDDPVNRYLHDFQLPKAFGREVTIRELASHNAGLDDSLLGAGNLIDDPPRFFVERFPGYFENTGPFSSYSSYDTLVLAEMVSQISGIPFAQYVHETILRPLKMEHSFLADPGVPLAHRIVPFQPRAPSKRAPGGELRPLASAWPSGPSVASAADMANFIAALLDRSGAQATITPAMQDLIFTVHQSNGTWGSAHGLLFDALRLGGATIFNHGGKAAGSNCLIAIDRQQDAGLFYCYGHVQQRFDLDPALFPPDYEVIKSEMLRPFSRCAPGAASNCPDYAQAGRWRAAWEPYLGSYVAYARHHHGPSRLRTILHPTTIDVGRAGDTLSIDGIDGYVEIAPGAFGSPKAIETFCFVNDPATGKIVLSGSGRPSAYEHPRLLESPEAIPRLLAGLILVALSGIVPVLIPRYGISLGMRSAVAANGLIVVVGLGAMFGLHAFGDPYFEGHLGPLQLVRAAAFLSLASCLGLLLALPSLYRRRLTGIAWIGRLHLSLITLESLLMVLTLINVELIGFGRFT